MIRLRAGFTIIEVLIVTAISALLAGVLFTSFWQTQRLEQVIDDLVTDDQTITRLYNQFEKDINGFFIPALNLPVTKAASSEQKPPVPGQVPTPPQSPTEADKEAEKKITKLFVANTKNKMLNLLSLVSNNVLAVYNKQKPLVCRIVYRLEPSKRFEGTFAFTRQELSMLDAKAMEEKNKQTQAYIIADSIASLTLTFVYEEMALPSKSKTRPEEKPEIKKVVEWDSDAITKEKESKQPLIPDMIEMELTLRNPTDGTTSKFNFVFPILVAQGIEEQRMAKPETPSMSPSGVASAKTEPTNQQKKPPAVGAKPGAVPVGSLQGKMQQKKAPTNIIMMTGVVPS